MGSTGTVMVKARRYYRFPLASGGTDIKDFVHIGYERDGDLVRLTNVPDEGIFRVNVRVRATQPDGPALETANRILFEGDVVELADGYEEKAMHCMLGPLRIETAEDVEWPAIDFPGVEKMLGVIKALVTSSDPAADQVLVDTRLAHGKSFNRALLFQPGSE